MPMRSGQTEICSAPQAEIARSLTSSQTFLVVCQRAMGIPNLSINSVCHCSQSVAGAKIIIGLRRRFSFSVSKHNARAAVASDKVLPKPTSSASNSRTTP